MRPKSTAHRQQDHVNGDTGRLACESISGRSGYPFRWHIGIAPEGESADVLAPLARLLVGLSVEANTAGTGASGANIDR